jgi:hypothetical protein
MASGHVIVTGGCPAIGCPVLEQRAPRSLRLFAEQPRQLLHAGTTKRRLAQGRALLGASSAGSSCIVVGNRRGGSAAMTCLATSESPPGSAPCAADAPTRTIAGFEQHEGQTPDLQEAGGAQTGDTAADDGDWGQRVRG